MGSSELPRPCLFLLAVFSRHRDAIDWARARAESEWGPVALESKPVDFDAFTDYYQPTMGSGLTKVVWAFQRLVDPAQLTERKRISNAWEEEFAAAHDAGEPRPLNLDPGYLSEAKLVLATTKDRDHRIYLQQGIYAEVTLAYRHGAWEGNPWTYPDYRSAEYHAFFMDCRRFLRAQYRDSNRTGRSA